MDGGDTFEIFIYTNPDELTRRWAHAQSSMITVPQRDQDSFGKQNRVRMVHE